MRIIAEDLRGPFLPTPKIISLPTYAPNDAIVVWDETNLIYAARIDIDPQILDFISTCEPFWPPQGDESTESPSRGFVKNPNIAVDGSTILLSWEFVQWDMGAESPTLRLKSDIFLKAFDLGLQPDEDFPLFRSDALNISNTLYGSSNILFNNDLANPEFWITYGHKNPDIGLLTNITGLSYPTQMGEDNRYIISYSGEGTGVIDYVCNPNWVMTESDLPFFTIISNDNGSDPPYRLSGIGGKFHDIPEYFLIDSVGPYNNLDMISPYGLRPDPIHFLTAEGPGSEKEIFLWKIAREIAEPPNYTRSNNYGYRIGLPYNISNSRENSIHPALEYGNPVVGIVYLDVTERPSPGVGDQFSTKNLALTCASVASSEDPINNRYNAIDGNEETRWSSNESNPILTIKLPEKSFINMIVLKGVENIAQCHIEIKTPSGSYRREEVPSGPAPVFCEFETIKTDEIIFVVNQKENPEAPMSINEIELYLVNGWGLELKFQCYNTRIDRLVNLRDNSNPRFHAPPTPRQGQPLSVYNNQPQLAFFVYALDRDGDKITLTANNLPQRARFTQPHANTDLGRAVGIFNWNTANLPRSLFGTTIPVFFTARDDSGGTADIRVDIRIINQPRPGSRKETQPGPREPSQVKSPGQISEIQKVTRYTGRDSSNNIAPNARAGGAFSGTSTSDGIKDNVIEELVYGRGEWASISKTEAKVTLDWSRESQRVYLISPTNKVVLYSIPNPRTKVNSVRIRVWELIPNSPDRELPEINLGSLPVGSFLETQIPIPRGQNDIKISKMEITLYGDSGNTEYIGLREVQVFHR